MIRVGFGYDSHRFAPDRPLMLGGIRIDHDRGLAGHSDGDAALHAITDAVLGAIAAGDIGEHFPDNDPRWAGADSTIFLEHAVKLARSDGAKVNNCDLTIIAETPKLSPYKQQMQARIAKLLGVAEDVVSIKAKTNEGLGDIGRGEGIVAMAAVTLVGD